MIARVLAAAAHARAPDLLPAWLNTEAERELTALSASRRDVAPMGHVVESAQPWRAILDLARDLNADVVVIGIHARHGVERILGTTSRAGADAGPGGRRSRRARRRRMCLP